MDLNDLEASNPPVDPSSFKAQLDTKKALFISKFAYPYNKIDMTLALDAIIRFVLEGK